MPLQLYTHIATDGLRVGLSPSDYVCKIQRQQILEQNSITFLADQQPRQTARYTWCNNTQNRQIVLVAPLLRRSSDPLTQDNVYANHEKALIFSNSTV
jgi:hypothetical protein